MQTATIQTATPQAAGIQAATIQTAAPQATGIQRATIQTATAQTADKQLPHRERTKPVRIGREGKNALGESYRPVTVGGGHPIPIQSMTNTPTEDVEATVAQIRRLEKAGCEIIRCTVPTAEAAKAISEIKKRIRIPLVADIHFDYRMALAAMENGADKIRINPGNIGGEDKLRAVVEEARKRDVPIRVGVNSGSLEKPLLEKYGGVTAEGIVESALDKARMIEDMGYDKLVLSIKSSDVLMCVRAHELLAEKTLYPLHIGITEAGTIRRGTVKSAAGLGIILYEGIGDTIRVSLTGDPAEEVAVAKQLLRSMGLKKSGVEIVSCPTCGRTKIDLISLAGQVEDMVAELEASEADESEKVSAGMKADELAQTTSAATDGAAAGKRGFPDGFKIAVMGCVVNGPGEAREADIGIAGGDGEGLLIRRGEIIRKVKESELLSALREELLSVCTYT